MRISGKGGRAISEVVGTVLVASMTVIAGAAIFGYVNGQAGIASQAYGQAVGNSIQYLEEKYTVVDQSWATTTSATLWVYNTGKIQLTLVQVRLYDSQGKVDLLYNYSTAGGVTTNRVHDLLATGSSTCGISASSYESPTIEGASSFAVAISNTGTITLTIPPSNAAPGGQTCPSFGQTAVSGDAYTVTLLGTYGNVVTYTQVA